jgi:Fur family ferric uptake transcriptional regulator
MRASSAETIILETLEDNHSHLTAQEIYDQIRGRLPAVNRSTIYRALERLTQAGKVSVSDMGLGAAVYESVHNHNHHHLVCQNCHQVITIQDDEVANFFESIEQHYHFKINTNHLILFGTCPECSTEE